MQCGVPSAKALSAIQHRCGTQINCCMHHLTTLPVGASILGCLVLYDDEQYIDSTFPFTRYELSQPIHWSVGRWLDDNTRTAVPALATFLGFPAPRSERFAQATSNGLAAGGTLEHATLSAIYELIERDAFMLFWLSGRPGTRVADEGLSPAARDALRGVERLGATTELYLIDAGLGHPTMVCIGFGDGQTWPGVTIGLGTDADASRALEKAVFEHAHFGVYLRRLMLEDNDTAIHGCERCEIGSRPRALLREPRQGHRAQARSELPQLIR